MSKAVDTTTYMVEMKDGTRKKLTVPSSWKVTFGSPVPGKPGTSGYNSRDVLCLRFYEKSTQRACIVGVAAFRDTSIKIEEEIIDTRTERVRRETPEGEKDFLVEARVKEWRDPDKPRDVPSEFVALPPVAKVVKEST